MSEGRAAGWTYLVWGALVFLIAVRLATTKKPGTAAGIGLAGVALLAVGFVTVRHRSPSEPSLIVLDEHETPSGLGPLLSVPFLFIAMLIFASIPELVRRASVKDTALAVFLLVNMLGWSWFALHYKRVSVLDPARRAFEIRYGKPWILWRRSFPYADYQTIGIEEVERSRPRRIVYRVVAYGEGKRPRMLGFWYDRGSAKMRQAEIAALTGWKTKE